MPKLPRLSGREIIRILEQLHFTQIRQKGSHVILKKATPEGDIGCVVPLHKDVALGTLKGILKQARVSAKEFMSKLSS